MTPDQAVALAFADDAALNVSAFTPHPAVAEAPYAVVSSRDEDDALVQADGAAVVRRVA